MYIAGDLIRGHTETIILARLMQRDSYGYEINKTVRELSGGRYELKEATLYTAFKRLEETGRSCPIGARGYGRPAALLSHHPGRTRPTGAVGVWEATKEIIVG